MVSVGSIPAWAGKPAAFGEGPQPNEVYPRVGGETGTLSTSKALPTRRRVYPRVGGETVSLDARYNIRLTGGLSPRGRGNPERPLPLHCRYGAGSIPAWAGKPSAVSPSATGRRSRVYPRVGGETIRLRPYAEPTGLSRSIPAWAGKPLCHNDPVSQENEYVKDRWTYGDSPAIRRIRRHTSCASGSARWRGAAVTIDSTSQAVASEV